MALPQFNYLKQKSNTSETNLSNMAVNAKNEAASTVTVPMSVDTLVDHTDHRRPSVGLNMNGLVVEKEKIEKKVTTTEDTVVKANFGSLIVEKPVKTTSQFSISLLPDGDNRSMLPKPKPTMADNVVNALNSNKNNQTQQQSGKKVNNWFSRLLEQRGADYIDSGKLTIDEVSRNASRIIDDMISGKVDYDQYGKYIIMPIIINTLISYCTNKLAINTALQSSLGYYYNDYVNRNALQGDINRFNLLNRITESDIRNTTEAISIVDQDIAIFNILLIKLTAVNNSKNITYLYSLTQELNNYKKNQRKRY